MTGPFPDPSRRTSRFRPETSDDRSRAYQRRLDDQRFAICIAVVFGVGDRRAQGLADQRCRFTRAQVDDSQCLGDALSLDQTRNMTRLFRRDTHILGQSSHFHDWFPIVLCDCRPPGRLSDTLSVLFASPRFPAGTGITEPFRTGSVIRFSHPANGSSLRSGKQCRNTGFGRHLFLFINKTTFFHHHRAVFRKDTSNIRFPRPLRTLRTTPTGFFCARRILRTTPTGFLRPPDSSHAPDRFFSKRLRDLRTTPAGPSHDPCKQSENLVFHHPPERPGTYICGHNNSHVCYACSFKISR